MQGGSETRSRGASLPKLGKESFKRDKEVSRYLVVSTFSASGTNTSLDAVVGRMLRIQTLAVAVFARHFMQLAGFVSQLAKGQRYHRLQLI